MYKERGNSTKLLVYQYFTIMIEKNQVENVIIKITINIKHKIITYNMIMIKNVYKAFKMITR